MATNAELITNIEKAATEKGVDVPETEGKNNAQLAAMLKELRAANAAPLEPVKPEVKQEARPDYVIGEGKSIAYRGELISEGEEFKKSWLDDKSFKAHVEAGNIVKG